MSLGRRWRSTLWLRLRLSGVSGLVEQLENTWKVIKYFLVLQIFFHFNTHTDSEKSLSALYCSSSFCRWVRLEKAWKLMVLSLLCDRISVTRFGRSRNEPVSISCNKYLITD